jgi:hypothetical protein
MLELKIRFESSWTNSFYVEPGGAPLFTSGSGLSASLRPRGGLKAVDFDREAAKRSGSRLAFLQALQAANPELLYRVPVNFDRAVQGVLARLVGEVRRLSDVEASHLSFRAFQAGKCDVHIEHEHSQTTKLATYEINDIQTGGAGLITNDALYSVSEISRYLFGHLGQSLTDIEFSIDEILLPGPFSPALNWYPGSPAALIDSINALDEEQGEVIKQARKAAGKGLYVTPYERVFSALALLMPGDANVTMAKQEELHKQGKAVGLSIESGALDGWSIAGATVVARIKLLSNEERAAFIAAGALTKLGGLSGMAMSGGVGNITPKDLFYFASGARAESGRMPYGVDVPVMHPSGRTQFVPSGVLKKTGTITFKISDAPELEHELHTAIEAASVGPFHFGKKGIAYVQSLDRY